MPLSREFMMGWKRSRSRLRSFSLLLSRSKKPNASIRLSSNCNIIQIISLASEVWSAARCQEPLRNCVSAWHLCHASPWIVLSLLVRSTGVRPQGAPGSWVAGSTESGATVHNDAYVNRLKRRLHVAEEVAMKHGATQAELKRDSTA